MKKHLSHVGPRELAEVSDSHHPNPRALPYIVATSNELIADDRLWMSPAGIARRYSVCRTVVYGWLQKGEVKSVSLRKRGNIRGARRIFVPSVDALFDRFARERPNAATRTNY